MLTRDQWPEFDPDVEKWLEHSFARVDVPPGWSTENLLNGWRASGPGGSVTLLPVPLDGWHVRLEARGSVTANEHLEPVEAAERASELIHKFARTRPVDERDALNFLSDQLGGARIYAKGNGHTLQRGEVELHRVIRHADGSLTLVHRGSTGLEFWMRVGHPRGPMIRVASGETKWSAPGSIAVVSIDPHTERRMKERGIVRDAKGDGHTGARTNPCGCATPPSRQNGGYSDGVHTALRELYGLPPVDGPEDYEIEAAEARGQEARDFVMSWGDKYDLDRVSGLGRYNPPERENGMYDPGVLKLVFLAGGPGSGKSHTAAELFGVPTGHGLTLTASTGLKLVNGDPFFEFYLHKLGIDPKTLSTMPPEEFARLTEGAASPRGHAKRTRDALTRLWVAGRLGLIMDGTGDDYAKIARQVQEFRALGYDAFMIFVNTSLEVAQERNAKRARRLPSEVVRAVWTDVQANMGAFQALFGARNIVIVDNTVYGPIPRTLAATVSGFLRRPVENAIGRQWLQDELARKAESRGARGARSVANMGAGHSRRGR